MKKIVSLALAAAATFAAAPASAHDAKISDDGRYRIAIPFADLNLSTEEGRQALNGRLQSATNEVCGTPRPMSLLEVRLQGACRTNVAEAARPKVALAIRSAGAGVVVAEGR